MGAEFERMLDDTLAVGMGDEYFQPWSKGLEDARAALIDYHERAIAELEREGAERLNKTVRKLIRAWESLPEGTYSPRQIQDWLVRKMKPAIDAARKGVSDE